MYVSSEVWTSSGKKLRVFEEIILNRTFGPMEDGAGIYELRNHEWWDCLNNQVGWEANKCIHFQLNVY
jgi:hypothetical protein